MHILFEQILNNREAAALPGMLESGGLPALISGLSSVHRACLAAALKERPGRPLIVICPDEAACESLARDLPAMLGERAWSWAAATFTFYSRRRRRRGRRNRSACRRWTPLPAGGAPPRCFPPPGLLHAPCRPKPSHRPAQCCKEGGAPAHRGRRGRPGALRLHPLRAGGGPRTVRPAGRHTGFFSPAYDKPVRIEFWGDDIDSMGLFDTASQRRTETLPECRILPAAETLVSLCQGGRDALADENRRLRGQMRREKDRAPRLRRWQRPCGRTRIGSEGGAHVSDADRYLPLLYPFASALDYIPPTPWRCWIGARQHGRAEPEAI
jgi:transcription-repair coupling factor (superfamily II helicase)